MFFDYFFCKVQSYSRAFFFFFGCKIQVKQFLFICFSDRTSVIKDGYGCEAVFFCCGYGYKAVVCGVFFDCVSGVVYKVEKALVRQIEDFMLELGRGFMFVGTQQRVTLNNTHYYVDMVFYNKELHAYVLIELKTVKLMPEAVGQLNMYLNYYAAEVNEPGDNPPIGIILCTDKDNVSAEYALGGLSNNIFASTYTYVIPEKEKLIAQVEAVLEQWKEKED